MGVNSDTQFLNRLFHHSLNSKIDCIKKLTSLKVSTSLIILGGDLGIVDTWHATINFKIMVHA